MVANTKQVQSYVNKLADAAKRARDARDDMLAIRTLFIAAAPDTTGTAVDGNESIISAAIGGLDTEMSKGIWTQVIAAEVPSHRGEAL